MCFETVDQVMPSCVASSPWATDLLHTYISSRYVHNYFNDEHDASDIYIKQVPAFQFEKFNKGQLALTYAVHGNTAASLKGTTIDTGESAEMGTLNSFDTSNDVPNSDI